MKKLACFGLIIVMLMNTMGYYAIFVGFQLLSDQKIANQVENNSYDPSRLFTIKVPVSIPYFMDQTEFSQAEGKFLHEGKHYRMVMQRYAQDTLTVICLRDINKEHIQHAFGDYVKKNHGESRSAKETSHSLSVIKDFIRETCRIETLSVGWFHGISETFLNFEWASPQLKSVAIPPERC